MICDPATFSTTFENQSIIASIVPEESTLSVKRRVDFQLGTVTARGQSNLRGYAALNLDSITLRHLFLDVDDFDIKAPNIGTVSRFRDGKITLREGPITAPVDAAGMFQFPAEQMEFIVAGREDGDEKTRLVSPNDAAQGILDESTRSIRVSVAGDSGDESYSISLTGTIVNHPPDARINVPATLECDNGNRGATVQLDGSATFDRDGADDLVHLLWSVNGELAGKGPSPTVHLPLGGNRITLLAIDRSDAIGKTTVHVVVEDTRPPALTVSPEPECLWPPNQKLVRFGLAEGLAADAVDACTGTAGVSVRVVDVGSSQPANSTGDGNSAPDVFFDDSAVCLRAERSGRLLDRSYSIVVEAIDDSGNRTEEAATVLVPHDRRRPVDRCTSVPKPHDFLEDGDPGCSFDSSSPSTSVVTEVLR